MQISGTGNGHDPGMHQITKCIHSETVSKRNGGAVPTSHSGEKQTSAIAKPQPDGQFSLAAWLKDKLSDGRKLLQRIWGEKAAGDDLHTGQLATTQDIYSAGYEAVSPVPVRQQVTESNSYFAAIEDTGKEKQSIWEKVKVKFHSIAGQLLGRFSNRNSLQSKQEKPKEDLRKHSTYRQDDVEIDCILTDDSYLMDSYDRKGEYSKLSVKK